MITANPIAAIVYYISPNYVQSSIHTCVIAKVAPNPRSWTRTKRAILLRLTRSSGSSGSMASGSRIRKKIFAETPEVNSASVPMYHYHVSAVLGNVGLHTNSPAMTPLGIKPKTVWNGAVMSTRPGCQMIILKSWRLTHITSLELNWTHAARPPQWRPLSSVPCQCPGRRCNPHAANHCRPR